MYICVQVTRRAGFAAMLAAAGLLARQPRAEAAFGEAANIFGKTSNTAGAWKHCPRASNRVPPRDYDMEDLSETDTADHAGAG